MLSQTIFFKINKFFEKHLNFCLLECIGESNYLSTRACVKNAMSVLKNDWKILILLKG